MNNYFKLRKIWKLSPQLQVSILIILYLIQIGTAYIDYKSTGLMFGLPLNPILVFAPIYEEIIFRGIIFGLFVKTLKWKRAIFYSSALFGLWHVKNIFFYDIEQLITQITYTSLFLGPLLAYTTYRAKSIWPAVMIHFLNNIWSPISFTILTIILR